MAYRDFNSFSKGEPSVGDVHVSTALGNSGKGRKRKPQLTTVGPTATLTKPADVTSLAAVDFNHAHNAGPDDRSHGEPTYIVRPRQRDPKHNTIGKPVVATGTLKGDTPQVGDLLSIESDTGTASNAPWTSEITWADGWSVKVAYDDGEAIYRLNRANLISRDKNRGKTGRPYHWRFSKHDLPAVKTVKVGLITVEVETPKGHRRIEADEHGIHHDVVFGQDYGRIPGTLGADRDEVDAYVGELLDSTKVWVINQVVTGRPDLFDETKLMLGFAKKRDALAAYMQSHSDGRGDERLAEMLRTDVDSVVVWLNAGEAHTTAPFPGGALHEAWSEEKSLERAQRAKIEVEKRGQEPERKLVPFARGLAKNPFPVHRHAMSLIRPDQTPRFLEALTHRKRLDKRKMKLGDLTAIQDRVDPQKVEAIRQGEHNPKDRPVIVKFAGRNYIVDGDHHLAADWLDGKDRAKVRFLDISARTEAMKRAPAHTLEPNEFRTEFKVLKTDPDQQLVFGWASVSEIDGVLVTDKQGDQIEPHELEAAAYDFVLYSRDQGHMHEEVGVGQMIESCVFTIEKQQAMGIDLGFVAWWTGFKVTSKRVWGEIRAGNLPEFSIGGYAVPVEV